MRKKLLVGLFVVCVLSFIVIALSFTDIFTLVRYELTDKSHLNLNLSLVDSTVKTLACEPSNKLVLNVAIRDTIGQPVPMARISLSVSADKGTLSCYNLRTDRYGEALFTYYPPIYNDNFFKNGISRVDISSEISDTSVKSVVPIKLIPTPVVLVHGYQASSASFDNMLDYLSSKSLLSSGIDYASEDGVASGAEALDKFLQKQMSIYLSKGILVKKFDLIAHSMGGLVCRYYTCGEHYIKNENVRKIIFISVPHKGSPLAPLGEAFYHDKGIKDLIPNSSLYTDIFPKMINKGLNSTIQVGSIYGQFDEVVDPESVSLEEWNIKTSVFAIGENNFNTDNILNGNIANTTNHNSILSNSKVFSKIFSLLSSELAYPAIRH